MMGSMRQFVVAVGVIVTGWACTNESPVHHVATPFAEIKGDALTLQRNVLGREFLLTSTLIAAGPSPQVQPIRPKIVAFELHQNTVALIELHTAAIYDSLPNGRLLDTFPVTDEDAQSVTFAWNQGLHVITVASPQAASDIPGSLDESLASGDTALPILAAYVKSARRVGDALELVQVSRVLMEAGEHSVEVHTRFSPYRSNPRFEPLESRMADGIGFFEVARLQPGTGAVTPLATRWDVSEEAGPIDYALAADTPAYVRQAISDGVLYWNRVAGRTIVRVSQARADAVVAKPHQVLVHWIPWTNAGYASSASQPDPLTGEILSGEIFLTSFWVGVVENFAHDKLLTEVPLPGTAARTVAPAGFASAQTCAWLGQTDRLQWGGLIAESAASQNPLLPVALDHLRAVVAHEVGHTLGLRHNFAASLGSELQHPDDQQAAWERYLVDGSGARTSVSVMDYTSMTDTLLEGAGLNDASLAYDTMAIRWGYGDAAARRKAETEAATLPFCTDMEAQVGSVLGCQLDDSGPAPLSRYRAALRDSAPLATAVLMAWLGVMEENPQMSAVQAAGHVNPSQALGLQVRPAFLTFQQLQQGAQVLSVDRLLGGKNWLNAKAYREATLDAQQTALAQVEGLPGLLHAAFPTDAQGGIDAGWLTDVLSQRLQAWRGSLVSAEVADDMLAALPLLGEKLEDVYVRAVLKGLTGDTADLSRASAHAATYAEGLADVRWAQPLATLASSIILAESGETQGSIDGRPVSVGTPRYSLRTRMQATRLFEGALFQMHGWATEPRRQLAYTLLQQTMAVASEPVPAGVTPAPRPLSMPSLAGRDASPRMRQWVDETVAILRALMSQAADD